MIRILEVYENKKKQMGLYATRQIVGYWVKFKHLLVEGMAFFVPYGNENVKVIKDNYSVETTQDEVLEYKLLNGHQVCKFEYNEQDDYYIIIGQVVFISNDKEIVSVSVLDIAFTFDHNEIDIEEIQVNDWVEVSLRGLTFYDEGIY